MSEAVGNDAGTAIGVQPSTNLRFLVLSSTIGKVLLARLLDAHRTAGMCSTLVTRVFQSTHLDIPAVSD